SGAPLKIVPVRKDANYHRYHIMFERPYFPGEVAGYTFRYVARRMFERGLYFRYRARGAGRNLRFALNYANGQRLQQATVYREIEGGPDLAGMPIPQLSNERGVSRLTWEIDNFSTGDVFCTAWSLVP